MNKRELVAAVSAHIGDRRSAAAAVDCVLDTIVRTVGAGESVAIIGFGVFEGRARAARVARNPGTGAAVAVPATTVPAFRPGAGFRTAVAAGSAAGAVISGNGSSTTAGNAGSGDRPAVATAEVEAQTQVSAKPGKARKAGKKRSAASRPAPAVVAEAKPAKGKKVRSKKVKSKR